MVGDGWWVMGGGWWVVPASAKFKISKLRISRERHFQLTPRPNIQFRNQYFAGGAFPADAPAKYKNAKYEDLVVYTYIYILYIIM